MRLIIPPIIFTISCLHSCEILLLLCLYGNHCAALLTSDAWYRIYCFMHCAAEHMTKTDVAACRILVIIPHCPVVTVSEWREGKIIRTQYPSRAILNPEKYFKTSQLYHRSLVVFPVTAFWNLMSKHKPCYRKFLLWMFLSKDHCKYYRFID